MFPTMTITKKKDNIEQKVGDLLRETTFKDSPEDVDLMDSEELMCFGLDLVMKTISAIRDSAEDHLLRIEDLENEVEGLVEIIDQYEFNDKDESQDEEE